VSEPTEIVLGKKKGDLVVAKALREYLASTRKAKEFERKADKAKAIVREFANVCWLDIYSRGLLPQMPFKVITAKGESVGFVVQDKTAGAKLTPEAEQELTAIIGGEAMPTVVGDEISLQLDHATMNEMAPGPEKLRVGDVLAARLGSLRYELAAEGLLTQEQAGRIFQSRPVRVLKPSLLGRLPGLVAGSAEKIAEVLSVLSGSVVRFIRA
jgi:hypothetical protein